MSYLLLLLLATGPRAEMGGGQLPEPDARTIYVSNTGVTLVSITAVKDTLVSEVRWVTTTAGLGVAGSMTIALRDDGVAVCTISIPCDAIMSASIIQPCGVLIVQGSAVDVVADRSACNESAPEGNLTYAVAQ